MKIRSDFMFARPSFLEGTARIFDSGGTLNEYNYDKFSTGAEADAAAIASDWAAVWEDLAEVMGEWEEVMPNEQFDE